MEKRYTVETKIYEMIDNCIDKLEEKHDDIILKNKDKVDGYIDILFYCLEKLAYLGIDAPNKEISDYVISASKDVIPYVEDMKKIIKLKKEKENGQKI